MASPLPSETRDDIVLAFLTALETSSETPEAAKARIAREQHARLEGRFSLQQITAAISQVTIQLRAKLLKPAGLSDADIHPNQLPFVLDYIRVTQPQNEADMTAMAADLQLAPTVVGTISSLSRQSLLAAVNVALSAPVTSEESVVETTLEADPLPPEEDATLVEEQPVAEPSPTVEVPAALHPAEEPPADPTRVPTAEVRVTGADFNYDNPEKNAWREHVVAYVCSKIPRQQRADKKLICFGGARNLEPQAYIAEGFTPGNILSVERDSKAKSVWETSAAAMGIQTYFGPLDELGSPVEWDVVSLDYTGPMGVDKMNDVRLLLVAKRALGIVNLSRKREQLGAKLFTIQRQRSREYLDDLDVRKVYDSMPAGEVDMSMRLIEASEEKLEHEEWEEERPRSMIDLVSHFGEGRKERLQPNIAGLGEILMPSSPDCMGKLRDFATSFGPKLHDAYQAKWRVEPPPLIKMMGTVVTMSVEQWATRRLLFQDISLHPYVSKNDKGGSNPFLTVCAELAEPDFYKRREKIMRSIASLYVKAFNDRCAGKITIKDGTKKVLMIPRPTINVTYAASDGSSITVDFADMMEAMAEFKEIGQKHHDLLTLGEDEDLPENVAAMREAQPEDMEEFWRKVRAKQQKTEQKRRMGIQR